MLENTKITDQGLKNLSALTALKRLYLDGNVIDIENDKVINTRKNHGFRIGPFERTPQLRNAPPQWQRDF